MMQKVCFLTPFLYADHHVQEVRRILLALPGVVEVYASSCFHVIEVSFDPAAVSDETIKLRLDQAGYLADLPQLIESTAFAGRRRTALGDQTRAALGFQQDVPAQSGVAWPCPGMGLLKAGEEKHG
jgi:hypothetical protein